MEKSKDIKENLSVEVQSNIEKTEQTNSKISKLKSIFTPEILDQHSSIKEQFDNLDIATDKEAIIRNIINILKNEPETLKSIIDQLG